MRTSFANIFLVLVAAMTVRTELALAQSYPTKPIRFIVPQGAGGSSDVVARAIAQKLSESLGQQVVVENRPGANAIIGTEVAAKAAPDGYTIFLGTSITHAVNPSLYSRLSYDPLQDFAPITLVGQVYYLLLVHPSMPTNSVKDLITLAKAKPGQLNYAAGGHGTRIGTEMFNSMAGVRLTDIPYKSTTEALTGLLAGQVHVMFEAMITSLPHIKTGKLKALAVTSTKRLPMIPDIPTLAESDVPGYEYSAWIAIYAPAKVPKEILQRLNIEIIKILNMPDIMERLRSLGFELQPSSPEQLAVFTKSEIAKYAKVIKDARISVE